MARKVDLKVDQPEINTPTKTAVFCVQVKLENVISEFIKLSPASSVPVMPNVEPFNLEEMKTRIWDQGH